MPNNITINGNQFATDEVAGTHIQLCKLVAGAEDSAQRVDATGGAMHVHLASNGLVAPLPANVSLIGGAALSLGPKLGAASLPITLATDAPAMFVRPLQLATYQAVYRLAARPYSLSLTFVANTRRQIATIWHPANATKKVDIRSVLVAIRSVNLAALVSVELVRITSQPTGGAPAIVPTPTDSAAAASEAVCLALPSVAATEGAAFGAIQFDLGITGVVSVANPPAGLNYVELCPRLVGDEEMTRPSLRAGVAEGWAVVIDCNAASLVTAQAIVRFTEE